MRLVTASIVTPADTLPSVASRPTPQARNAYEEAVAASQKKSKLDSSIDVEIIEIMARASSKHAKAAGEAAEVAETHSKRTAQEAVNAAVAQKQVRARGLEAASLPQPPHLLHGAHAEEAQRVPPFAPGSFPSSRVPPLAWHR